MARHRFLLHPGNPDRSLVLLPGFATDCRIFEGLFRDATRICPMDVEAGRLAEMLSDFLRARGIGPVTALGWSLGAFQASDFAASHPDMVDRLVLIGARRRYDPAGLARFRRSLAEDRRRGLLEFYTQCFLPAQRTGLRRFRELLLPSYLREMDPARLLRDLDYLETAEIRPDRLPARPSLFVHGARDVIAPVAEARRLAARVPGASLRVLPGAAHAAFLAEEFASVAGEIRPTGESG